MEQLAPSFNGKTVAVMGLGKSGIASARALAANGATVLVWDDQPAGRAAASVLGVTLSDLSIADWTAIDLLVWSPGIAHIHPVAHPVAVAARAAGVRLVCDIDVLLMANPRPRVVAITGTNGKSTTTTLIGHVLAGMDAPLAVGGNLGIPAFELPILGPDGTYVLELSSFQLELLEEARLDVTVLLNITTDHLARHGGMEVISRPRSRCSTVYQPAARLLSGLTIPLLPKSISICRTGRILPYARSQPRK